MSLSSLVSTLPKYQITLPMSGIKVEYRPFIVKEEKILLMAAETKNEASMLNAMRDVIETCTEGKVDIMKMPTVDIEYLFLQLRSNSIGETSKPMIKCEKCETPNEVTINLKEITPTIDSDHNKKVHLIEDIYVMMRHPNMNDVERLSDYTDEMEKALMMVVKCIDKVINGDTVYNAYEMDPQEVREFVENLTQTQFNKLLKFIETMPSLQKQVQFACRKCAHENSVLLRGMANFF